MEEEIRQEVEAKAHSMIGVEIIKDRIGLPGRETKEVDNLTLMSMTMAMEKRTMTTTVENRTMIIIKV